MRWTATLTLGVMLAILLAAPAGAITSSQVTTPADPTFLNPDNDSPAPVPLTVSGTAEGAGNVDLACLYNNGNDIGSIPAANVTVSGGAFSTTIDQLAFAEYICRIVAVPAGAPPPYDLNAFRGPVVSNAGFELFPLDSGPNVGQLEDYFQASSALEGYFSVGSAGGCYVEASAPLVPSTLQFNDSLFDCSSIEQGLAPPIPSLRVDGRNAYLPSSTPEFEVPGYRGIENLEHGIDPAAAGVLRVSDSEPTVFCEPADASCNSLTDAGFRVDQKQTGGTAGHTLAINHHWVNTTKVAKQLDVTYSIELGDPTPGWRFPGEAGYAGHAQGDQVTPPASGPASFFVSEQPGSGCPDVVDPCGSVTWYQPPQAVAFDDSERVLLTYNRTISPGGSAVIALTYSQGFPQSAVDGYAAAAEDSFDTAISFGKLKRNKKKGKATLAVEVPGAGDLHLEGKGLKTVDIAAGASGLSTKATARAATTVKLLIKPKGKAKKKLKRKGKAKLTADVTYTRTDLEPTEASKKVKLKQKSKKR